MAAADNPPCSPHDLDVLTAVARIQQIAGKQRGTALADDVLDRLAECDVPRLLDLCEPDAIAWAVREGFVTDGR